MLFLIGLGEALMELPDLPEDWQWKSLIEVDGRWGCFCCNGLFYLQAFGSSPRYALLDAIARIEDGAYNEVLSGGKRHEIDLVAALNIPKPKPIRRV
jgi:hypothetical protein